MVYLPEDNGQVSWSCDLLLTKKIGNDGFSFQVRGDQKFYFFALFDNLLLKINILMYHKTP